MKFKLSERVHLQGSPESVGEVIQANEATYRIRAESGRSYRASEDDLVTTDTVTIYTCGAARIAELEKAAEAWKSRRREMNEEIDELGYQIAELNNE